MSKSLVEIIDASGVDDAQALMLGTQFQGFQDIANEWGDKAKAIVVTDGSQTELIADAKGARLFLKEKLKSIKNIHKELKESSLKKGQALDAIARHLRGLIEPIITHLTEQENFVEIQEDKRKRELFEKRRDICVDNGIDFTLYNITEMPEDDFQRVIDSKIDADIKAEKDRFEQERFAKEKMEREEKERQRMIKQNEKLRADKKKADEEKRAAQAKTKAADEKRLNAEADAAREKKKAELALRREKTAKDAKAKVVNKTVARMVSAEEMIIIARKALTHVHQGTGSECKWCAGNRIIIERIIGQIGGFLD